MKNEYCIQINNRNEKKKKKLIDNNKYLIYIYYLHYCFLLYEYNCVNMFIFIFSNLCFYINGAISIMWGICIKINFIYNIYNLYIYIYIFCMCH